MEVREVRALGEGELQKRLEEAYRELFVLRREKAAGRLVDYNRIRVVRGDIARMRTVLRERQLSAELLAGGGEAQ